MAPRPAPRNPVGYKPPSRAQLYGWPSGPSSPTSGSSKSPSRGSSISSNESSRWHPKAPSTGPPSPESHYLRPQNISIEKGARPESHAKAASDAGKGKATVAAPPASGSSSGSHSPSSLTRVPSSDVGPSGTKGHLK
ncbi:unnamed protein product [Sympodiomycopsis kandeliae]